jgi:predicted nucleic acid-binding protein
LPWPGSALDFLKSDFATITIPQIVYDEVVTPDRLDQALKRWLPLTGLRQGGPERRCSESVGAHASLDRGETKAIVIAHALKTASLLYKILYKIADNRPLTKV